MSEAFIQEARGAAAQPAQAMAALLTNTAVLLGTKSSSRQALMREMGVPFHVWVRAAASPAPLCACLKFEENALRWFLIFAVCSAQTADIDEKAIRRDSPEELARPSPKRFKLPRSRY